MAATHRFATTEAEEVRRPAMSRGFSWASHGRHDRCHRFEARPDDGADRSADFADGVLAVVILIANFGVVCPRIRESARRG